jgi:hypothetical protein
MTPTMTPTPTETPTPTITPTPTETPDPLSRIDLQNPATYPEWMSYFTRGEFPSVEAQKAMSADMFQLYRNLLIDHEIEGVEAMNDSQVFFMAGQIANQEGWNLPANLDATRAWFAGPQAAFYRNISESIVEDGTFTMLRFTNTSIGLQHAYTPGEITTNTFGQDVLLQRIMSFWGIRAHEGILVNLTDGKSAIILHYVNNNQDYYMPLSVTFSNTTATARIGKYQGQPSRVFPMSAIIPSSIGSDGAVGIWTENDLRNRLINAEDINIDPYNNGVESDPIIAGLEFAYRIIISP